MVLESDTWMGDRQMKTVAAVNVDPFFGVDFKLGIVYLAVKLNGR